MVTEGSQLQDSSITGMEWKIYPIKRNWRTSVVLIFFLVILCVAIYFSFDSLTFLLLSAVILICSLSPFFFPTRYILQDDRIMIRSLLRTFSKQWDFFKSYYPDKNGVLLSPFPSPSRLESFRGVYVRFDNNRSDVLDFIGRKIGRQ